MIDRIITIPNNNSFFLFGARGTGKTSLIKRNFEKSSRVLFIDLLNEDLLEKYLLSPQSLMQEVENSPAPPEWIVLDEVQKVPKLLNVVHQLIESPLKVKFALTGSSSRKLKQKGVNLLAGRAWLRNLYPLTFLEMGNAFFLEHTLNWGSLPTIVNLKNTEDKKDYLKSYTQTYIKTEIQEEQWVKKIEPFRKFLPIAAQMNGKPLNYSAIARDVGAEVMTVQNYYEILEDTLIGFHLPAYHKSIRKQQRQAPKFYFGDLGVKKALHKLTGVELQPRTAEWGYAFEHLIIVEAIRLNDYLQKDYSFSYLLTKDSFEVDLVIERPGKKTLFVEIKSTERIHAEDFSSFISFVEEVKGEGYVLSTDPFAKKIEKIKFLPWQEGLKEIFELAKK